MSFGKRIGLKLHIEKTHRAASELKQLSQGDDLAETSANLRTPTNMKKSENDKAAYQAFQSNTEVAVKQELLNNNEPAIRLNSSNTVTNHSSYAGRPFDSRSEIIKALQHHKQTITDPALKQEPEFNSWTTSWQILSSNEAETRTPVGRLIDPEPSFTVKKEL